MSRQGYYNAFKDTTIERCEGDACYGWQLSEVDTFHQCCAAGNHYDPYEQVSLPPTAERGPVFGLFTKGETEAVNLASTFRGAAYRARKHATKHGVSVEVRRLTNEAEWLAALHESDRRYHETGSRS